MFDNTSFEVFNETQAIQLPIEAGTLTLAAPVPDHFLQNLQQLSEVTANWMMPFPDTETERTQAMMASKYTLNELSTSDEMKVPSERSWDKSTNHLETISDLNL